jgi:hypothetical protein
MPVFEAEQALSLAYDDEEIEFCEGFSALVSYWRVLTYELLQAAFQEARQSGTEALDALHVVAAAHSGSEELGTSQKGTKRIYRTGLAKVFSIRE